MDPLKGSLDHKVCPGNHPSLDPQEFRGRSRVYLEQRHPPTKIWAQAYGFLQEQPPVQRHAGGAISEAEWCHGEVQSKLIEPPQYIVIPHLHDVRIPNQISCTFVDGPFGRNEREDALSISHNRGQMSHGHFLGTTFFDLAHK